MTPKIFISYRRLDSQDFTDRLFDYMAKHFGQENVFQDVGDATKIPIGVDFVEHLAEQVNQCDVVLVVIGEQWLTMLQERQNRLDDFVRIEVESALKQGKIIIPVLKSKTEMPMQNALPESIQRLARISASRVRPNPDFARDCETLAEGIRQAMARLKAKSSVQPPAPPVQPPASPVKNPEPPTDPAVQAALQRARDFGKTGKRNRDWTPFITTFSDLKLPDMPFCLVPTGTFQMGNTGHDNQKPIHPQTFTEPFYIAQYPVTNAQWRVAVKAGVVGEPQGGKAKQWYNDLKMANAPVVGITWFEAQQFVQWMGCRLLTEREWEYAARGVEGWVYPWGDDWDANKAIHAENSLNQPWGVTSKPDGASWVGARHLSGNVWEWTASLYQNYSYPTDGSREVDTGVRTDVHRVLRGGSWNNSLDFLRAAVRNINTPDNRYYSLGVRCARSPERSEG
jgi:formylglycine-generating enzyme required for sulfatase activity